MSDLLVPGTRSRRRGLLIAVAVCTVLFASTFAFGYLAIKPDWVAENNVGGGLVLEGDHWGDVVIQVLGRNVPVLLLLFTGAVSAGIGSAIPLLGVGFFVGATFRIGVEAASAADVLQAVGPYLFIELFACILAAAAGILPTITTLIGYRTARQCAAFASPSPLRRYTGALRPSLVVLGVALSLAGIAAVIEAAVIISHR